MRRRSALSCAAGLALLLGPAAAVRAAEIDIQVARCGSHVELKARDASLAEVLRRLSAALAFELRLEGTADSRITLSLAAPADEVVQALARRHGSFMIRHASDPRCPGVQRVATLWLAADAGRSSAAPAKRANAPAPVRRAAVTETATPERLRQVEQDSQRRKLAYEAYVREHGKPPPGEPEEVLSR